MAIQDNIRCGSCITNLSLKASSMKLRQVRRLNPSTKRWCLPLDPTSLPQLRPVWHNLGQNTLPSYLPLYLHYPIINTLRSTIISTIITHMPKNLLPLCHLLRTTNPRLLPSLQPFPLNSTLVAIATTRSYLLPMWHLLQSHLHHLLLYHPLRPIMVRCLFTFSFHLLTLLLTDC